jgi:hypothetical protein
VSPHVVFRVEAIGGKLGFEFAHHEDEVIGHGKDDSRNRLSDWRFRAAAGEAKHGVDGLGVVRLAWFLNRHSRFIRLGQH